MKPQRLDLNYRITWKGRWHVGSGYTSATADRLLRRWKGTGPPFVPGSQMKGVLRHHCERLAVGLGLEAVDPHAGAETGDRNLIEHFGPLAKSDLLIDRLFGTRYQGECLFVSNAVPLSTKSDATTVVHARTAIDRATGTVLDQHLFTTELAGSDLWLQGEIRARHPSGVLTQEDDDTLPYEYALLVAGVLSMDALGGDKSVGLGRCEISMESESLRWNGCRVKSPHDILLSFEEHEWAEMVKLVREEQPP